MPPADIRKDDGANCKGVDETLIDTTKFKPISRTNSPPSLQLPDELWITVLESHCTFPPEVFHGVMLNLIKNPNVTSSHLFRADISYDSGQYADHSQQNNGDGDLLKHLKAEYQPIDANLPGYDLDRTIVRQLIPRNPQLDKPLVQTCHFFQRLDENEERNVVLYIPHVQKAEDMPFYHPAVAKLAFLHRWRHTTSTSDNLALTPGTISISFSLFEDHELTTKLERTALKLLQTVHKHGQGQLAGYEKRVHLDRIVPQKRYQDTYTRLKAKYGRQLSEQWVEVTDPGKHVFEDISIAAFLIEIWRDMYRLPGEGADEGQKAVDGRGSRQDTSKPPFPGFVDIGCGNGLLVYILLSEGYTGWGFDARQRKTWSIFPQPIQDRLYQRLLVPDIFLASTTTPADAKPNQLWHNGVFEPGTFIISNHADELTPWTPLLAYLNDSAFIAIPCCSHDLSGARFRAPATTKASKEAVARLPQQAAAPDAQSGIGSSRSNGVGLNGGPVKTQAAETGSLKRTEAQKKMPSAYSTLCSYVASLAEEVGYEAEKEVLRIPSTRNQSIIGRHRRKKASAGEIRGDDDEGRKKAVVVGIVERELGKSIAMVAQEWIERAERLARKPGSGH